MTEYVVTIWSCKGYKPVAATIKSNLTSLKELKTQGFYKICLKRGWTKRELKLYGYLIVENGIEKLYKISVITKEELEKQREEREKEWKNKKKS